MCSLSLFDSHLSQFLSLAIIHTNYSHYVQCMYIVSAWQP